MKKILFALAFTVLLLPKASALIKDNYMVKDNNATITKLQYDKLIKIGYTKEEIDNFPLDLYNKFNEIGDDFECVRSDAYYRDIYIYENKISMEKNEQPIKVITSKISKSEYENAAKEFGTVAELKKTNYLNNSVRASDLSNLNYYETSYKVINILITKPSSISNDRVVTSGLTWKIMPKVRSYDVFAMRVEDGGTFSKNTQNGSYTYTLAATPSCNVVSSLTFTNKFSFSDSAWNSYSPLSGGNYTGIGFTHKLAENKIACYNDLGTPQIAEVTAMSSLIYANAYASGSITVRASYQHATSSVSYNSVAHSYNFGASGLGGVIVFNNGMGSYYDSMQGIYATL